MEKYDLQNAILKENARPSSEQAVASIKKPVAEYTTQKAASDTATSINSQKIAQGEKQFLTRLLFAHDQLKTFSKQNDLATLISAANVPVQLAANKKMSDSTARQEALVQKIVDMHASDIARQNQADAARIKEVQDFIHPPEPLVPNSPLIPDQPSLSFAAKLINPARLDYRRN